MEQALTIWRQIGDRWAIANTLTGLGDVAEEEKDYQAARTVFWREPNNQSGDSTID